MINSGKEWDWMDNIDYDGMGNQGRFPNKNKNQSRMKVVREILRIVLYCAIALSVAGVFHLIAKSV